MKLQLSQSLLEDIQAHLQHSYPNEGGGFLVGTLSEDLRLVSEVHHVENVFEAEEQFHRFLAESGAYQKIEDEADQRGLALLGYYHSHPNVPAIPSEFDRIHAWPFFAYLIVSVHADTIPEVRLWELSVDRNTFHEAVLEITSEGA